MTAHASFYRATALRRDTLSDISRARRLRALDAIRCFRVTVSQDGTSTRCEDFDRPPSLRELADRVGQDSYIVAFGAAARTAPARRSPAALLPG